MTMIFNNIHASLCIYIYIYIYIYVSNPLGNIVIHFAALLCRDVKCCNSSHQMALNTYASEISQALVAAAEVVISNTSEVGCINKKAQHRSWHTAKCNML